MKTRAQLNRAVRQEALREQLANKGLVQHVLEIAEKLADPTVEVPKDMVDRYRLAIDAKKYLISKYLPDMKSMEISGDPEAPLVTKTEVELVRPKNPDA